MMLHLSMGDIYLVIHKIIKQKGCIFINFNLFTVKLTVINTHHFASARAPFHSPKHLFLRNSYLEQGRKT